jgi:hypothetical protein
MKLTTMTQVTVDGVMQGNGGASEEDRRNGFERGGWALGKGDTETDAYINQTYQRADAFLFGRRTYELFAGSWGSWTVEDVPGWERPGRAVVPGRRPGSRAGPGRVAGRLEGRDDPGLPAGRTPTVRDARLDTQEMIFRCSTCFP